MIEPIVVRLKHSSYETLGSNSLLGFYADKMLKTDYSERLKTDENAPPPPLLLEIEQTDMRYRREKSGPSLVLMPEFVPYLMMEDIQSFAHQGIKVTIKVVEVSEPS